MKTRKILYADEGKTLTDGTNYGKVIFLATVADVSAYHEITDEEHEKILAAQETITPEG